MTRWRRGQAGIAPVAGLLALSVLLGLLASLASRRSGGADTAPVTSPYIQSYDGKMQSQARDATGGSNAVSGGSGVAGTAQPATVPGVPAAATAAARGVPGRPSASGPRQRLSAAVSTETGRELSALLKNADVSVLAVGHQGGSYAYSRTDGWLKLDGSTWVVVDYASLPPDLKAAYPPEVYGSGSARLQTAAHPGKGASKEGDANRDAGHDGGLGDDPFDPKRAPVAFEPTPDLDSEPKKKSKKAETP